MGIIVNQIASAGGDLATQKYGHFDWDRFDGYTLPVTSIQIF